MVGDRLGTLVVPCVPLLVLLYVVGRTLVVLCVTSLCRAPVLNDNDKRGDSTTGVPGIVRQVTLFRAHRRMVGNRGAS